MDIFSLIRLVCGLTFFLFGMKVMSVNLEKMAGGKLEQMLRKVTASPAASLVLGAIITIAVQSSSATTVMLVGLVNSGIMQFSQTLNVIFGANIGTTLTSWILSLSSIESDNVLIQLLKPKNFSPILAFIGILMVMFSKKDKRQSIGTIFVGFAVLMYGMEFMTEAVSPLADMPQFSELLVKFNNPILGVLVGTLFTGLIQSSAASIGILQALSLTGGITFSMAIPIIMGQNIGTCATSLISCIGTSPKAKRVAVVHVSIKIIGTVICLSVFELLNGIFHFPFAAQDVTPLTIALVHTIFNVVITILLMPFSKLLVKMTEWLVRDTQKSGGHSPVFTLDERLLRSPSVAIQECNNYTIKMSEIAKETLLTVMTVLFEYDTKTAEWILEQEEKLDALEDSLSTYLVKLSAEALSKSDSQQISKMLHVIGNFERLGDHAGNLLKVSRELYEKHISFTGEAARELKVLTDAEFEILTITARAYKETNLELADRVEPLEQVIDQLIATIRNNHINRLQQGACTIEMGFILSDLLTNYERISDHCSNIAVALIEVEHNRFETHKYLNGVKFGNSTFNTFFDEYELKYTI